MAQPWGPQVNQSSLKGSPTFERCSLVYLKCHSPSYHAIFCHCQALYYILLFVFQITFPIRIINEGRKFVFFTADSHLMWYTGGAWHITNIDKYLLSEWIIGIDQIKTVLLYRGGERIHEPILNNYFCEIFKVFMLIKMNLLKRLD